MFAKRSYATYKDVPWYRRNWFVILSLFLWPLWLTLILTLVTGDVYYKNKEKVDRYSSVAKAIILILIFAIVWFTYVIGDLTDWQ